MINITPLIAIIILIVTSPLGPYGMIFIKYGTKDLRKSIFHPIKNYHLFLGFFMLGVSFILYAVMLRFADVTTLYPLTALGYVWTTFLSVKHFNEKINIYKIIGISLIIISIILVSIGS